MTKRKTLSARERRTLMERAQFGGWRSDPEVTLALAIRQALVEIDWRREKERKRK